jgi:hypothetical protein
MLVGNEERHPFLRQQTLDDRYDDQIVGAHDFNQDRTYRIEGENK